MYKSRPDASRVIGHFRNLHSRSHSFQAPDMGAYEYGVERWLPGPDWQPGDFSWLLPSALNRVSFAKWILEYAIDEADQIMDADPDGDGRKNLFEYAFGGDPTRAGDVGHLPRIFSTDSGISLRHVIRDDANDITYSVEISPSLEADTWAPLDISAQTIEELEAGLSETLQDLGDIADKVFVRIRVTPEG